MNIYTAPHVSGAPDWSAVPSAEIGNLLWTESCGVRAWAQMCWTEEALRLRLRAAERDIRAEERGLRLRGNFYKCGDATVQPHYLAWNPVTSAVPAFHRPEDFGEIVLGG